MRLVGNEGHGDKRMKNDKMTPEEIFKRVPGIGA
jgi:hypothetical protein